MPTMDEARPSADDLQQRLDLETLFSDLSTRFIQLPAGEVDRAIEEALRRLCEPLAIELAVLWQWSQTDPDVIRPTHVYNARGIPRPSEPLRQDQYPWARQQVLAGRMVVISSLDDYPAEAIVDRESCRQLGIGSGLCLPLSVGSGPPIGALGLNCLQAERAWPDALLKQLQLMVQVFTHALDRQRRERWLLEGEARLAASAELAGLAFYEVDYAEGVARFDDRWRDLSGCPVDREQGLQAVEYWREHIHPDDRERFLSLRQKLYGGGPPDRLALEYRFQHPTHGQRWIHQVACVARRDATGRALKSYGVMRDITSTKLAEDALRELTRRLIRAHEDERALLARELHDDVTQRLAVLAIDVGRAELAAPHAAQADAMRSVREQLVRLSEDIHSLAYQLHPSILEELGLVEALRAECERRTRQGRLAVTMDPEPMAAEPGKDAQLCLFRVAQEALNNAARHAGVNAATVTLRRADDGVLLAVRDEGVGFDPASPGPSHSLGLAGMRERVNLVNGTLDIETAPGRGTTIVAWVPAHAGESAHDECPAAPASADRRRPSDGGRGAEEPARARVRPGRRGGGRARIGRSGRQLRPDIIVADVTMPHLNGIDALVQLRQRGDRVPVVFLTMHRDASFARRALDAGASGFVLKHSAPGRAGDGHPRRARWQDLPDAAARRRRSSSR